MIHYLLHSGLLIAAAYLFYWLLLRKETFYKLNRSYLCLVLLVCAVLPLISIPSWMSIQDDLWVSNEPVNIDQIAPINSTEDVKPIENITTEVANQDNSTVAMDSNSTPWYSNLNTGKILWILYLIGVAVFFITFIIQFAMIVINRNRLEFIQDDHYKIYEMTTDTSPFSFLHWIFINPALYDYETYSQILEHEKTHVQQKHYLDKLLAEFAVMVFWFNPFVWGMRKEITNNLEFLTDDTMLVKGTEKESYQLNLLKVSVPQHALSLTTNYNQSMLKTRIIMMNAKKSSARSSWKYLFILPLFGFSMISLNAVNEDASPNQFTDQNIMDEEGSFQESGSEITEVEMADLVPEESVKIEDQKVEVSNVDKPGEMLVDVKDIEEKIQKKVKEKIESKVGKFSPTSRFKNLDRDKTKPGFWQGSVEGNEVCFFLNNSHSKHGGTWTMNECFLKSEISNFNETGKGVFEIKRDPGTLKLIGEFEDGYGFGKFTFTENKSFSEFLKKSGVEGADELLLFQLFISNANKKFVERVTSNDQMISKNDIMSLAIHVGNEERLNNLEKIFKETKEEPNSSDMVKMAIHGVNADFVKMIKEISPQSDLSIHEIIKCKIHGVDKSQVNELKKYGFTGLSLSELVTLNIHNVNLKDMKALEEMGYDKLTIDEMKTLSIHGVSTSFVKNLHDLGFQDMDLSEIKKFAIHNVTESHIKGLREIGFDLSSSELVKTKIHGLNASRIKSIQDYGFPNINFDEMMDFAIHGVDKSYIQSIQEEGFNDLTPKDMVNLKIHGISKSYIRDLKELNLNDLSISNIKKAKIHGVSARSIRKKKEQGYSMPSIKDYIKLKIHGGM